MTRFILVRLGAAVPTLFLVALTVFFLVRLIPGDPASLMLGDNATAEQLAEARARLGLDQSIIRQFMHWLSNLSQGDFGISIVSGQPVLSQIVDRFSVSAPIVLVAVILATIIAVPGGMIAAWRQNGKLDLGLVTASTILLSLPTFWLGLMLLLFFGLKLGWLPVVGYVSLSDNLVRGFVYLIMPILTLMLHEIGVLLRMARASTLEVLQLDYISHARAKGLSEGQVLLHHALRNSFGPTWTLIGLILGNLLAGIAVIETVFTIPGLGRLLVDSIFARDYPVIQGCLIFITLSYVLVNLLIDLCYPLFDPRVTVT